MLKKILQRIKEYIDKYVLEKKKMVDIVDTVDTVDEETNFILDTFSEIFEEQYIDNITAKEDKPVYLGFPEY